MNCMPLPVDALQAEIAISWTYLSEFRAYRDPVKKKSFFFLALTHNAGLWNYADPEQLGAPIDYHEIRGHLRIGTVQVHNPKLRASLIEGREVTAAQDIQIRKAVHEGLMLISEWSGLRNPSQLHYLFWNVFRAVLAFAGIEPQPAILEVDVLPFPSEHFGGNPPSGDVRNRERGLQVLR